ncbi:MAG: hypothetical protein ACXVA9_04565, partial [Bdellovibrionales bacterium]
SAPINYAPQKTATVEAAIEHRYKDLVEKIKEVNGLVGAQLENCFVIKLEGKQLTLGVAEKHKFLFDKISHPDFKKKVGNYLNSYWGPGFSLQVALGGEAPIGSQPLPSPKALTEKIEGNRQQAIREAVEAHPLMQSVQSVFKAEIKSIKETKQ